MIDVHWNYEIRVHVPVVAIDHQVRMLPEIPGAIALTSRPNRGVFARSNHRARLQAVTIFVLDRVMLVVQNRIETLVQMRNVVAAVEKVVDEDLPVAIYVVGASVKVLQLADAEWCYAPDEAAEKFE